MVTDKKDMGETTTKVDKGTRKLTLKSAKNKSSADGGNKIGSKAKVVDTRNSASEDVKVKKISKNKVEIIKNNESTSVAKTTQKKAKTEFPEGITYATGKRKRAVAKVWLKKGSGKISINKNDMSNYLKRPILEVIVKIPLVVTQTENKYDIICTVTGGGLSGQAGAIKHGIARALNTLNAEAYRKDLKSAGLLTRDSRKVERKKAGLKKARKGQVFSKR